MTPSVRSVGRRLAVLLLAVVALAGCATVPGDSEVSVLRQVGDPAEPSAPPGPARGAGPLEIVRGWVLASAAAAERHGAARAFLTPQAAGRWDDGVTPVVVDDQVDTFFETRPGGAGQAAVRVRATRLGVLTPAGAFRARPGPVEMVVELAQTNGQWRIAALPPGTLVRRSDLATQTRPVRTWFVDTVGGTPVSEPRYLDISPSRSVLPRALQMLLAGPSESLGGAAVSALPPGATLRSEVTTAPDGVTVVDLARVGPLDGPRRLRIATQVGLTLAGVGVPSVRLLVDGRPLLPDRPEVTVEDLVATVPPEVADRVDLPVSRPPGAPGPASVPGSIVLDGSVRTLDGDPVAGPAGTGAYEAIASGASPGGRFAAVVEAVPALTPTQPLARLRAGTAGGELAFTGLEGRAVARPTWSPGGTEVWTAVDGAVFRAREDPVTGRFAAAGVDAGALAALGPVSSLRLSPDGLRLAAVVGGRLAVGAVVRDGTGAVRIAAVEVLRPTSLDGVLDVGWTGTDRLVAVGTSSDRPVTLLSVDGLSLESGPRTNLTPPVTAIAAAPGRALVAVDQNGAWSLPDDGGSGASWASGSEVWRSLPVGRPGSVPSYPG